MSMHEPSLFSGAEKSTWSSLTWICNALVYGQFSVSLSFLSDAPPACIRLLYAPRDRTSIWGHSRQLHTVVRSMADTLGRTLICWQALVILYCTFLQPCCLYSAGPNTELWFKAYRDSADRLPGPQHRLTVWWAIKCRTPITSKLSNQWVKP